MPTFPPRLRAFAIGAAALALVVVGAGGTFAASNPTTLWACYDVYGNVRMADVPQCKLPTGGRLVSWNTAGPTGPTGPAGPTGAAGPGSVAHVVFVSDTLTIVDQGFQIALTCKDGTPGHGAQVTVPDGSPEVTVAYTAWDTPGATFSSDAFLVATGETRAIDFATLLDLQVANGSGGAHVTAQATTSGTWPDPCTFVASY